MMEIKGLKKVPGEGCTGCCLVDKGCEKIVPCCCSVCNDGVSMIYISEASCAKPATLLYPMGSMGEEVEA